MPNRAISTCSPPVAAIVDGAATAAGVADRDAPAAATVARSVVGVAAAAAGAAVVAGAAAAAAAVGVLSTAPVCSVAWVDDAAPIRPICLVLLSRSLAGIGA